jgi:hypothetical protein
VTEPSTFADRLSIATRGVGDRSVGIVCGLAKSTDTVGDLKTDMWRDIHGETGETPPWRT